MSDRERDILERAVAAVAAQAAKANALIDDLKTAGLPEGGPVLRAKLIRLELLKVKGDLERELGTWVLDCRRCNRRVHWVAGIGMRPGHWSHAEPAPDHPPDLATWLLARFGQPSLELLVPELAKVVDPLEISRDGRVGSEPIEPTC